MSGPSAGVCYVPYVGVSCTGNGEHDSAPTFCTANYPSDTHEHGALPGGYHGAGLSC